MEIAPFVFTWVAGTFYFQQLQWVSSLDESQATSFTSLHHLPLIATDLLWKTCRFFNSKNLHLPPRCHVFFSFSSFCNHEFWATYTRTPLSPSWLQSRCSFSQQGRQTPTAASCRSSTGADLGVIASFFWINSHPNWSCPHQLLSWESKGAPRQEIRIIIKWWFLGISGVVNSYWNKLYIICLGPA